MRRTKQNKLGPIKTYFVSKGFVSLMTKYNVITIPTLILLHSTI
jgi:hypothetical protein